MGLRLAADPFLAMLLGPERGQGRAGVRSNFPGNPPEGRGSRGACCCSLVLLVASRCLSSLVAALKRGAEGLMDRGSEGGERERDRRIEEPMDRGAEGWKPSTHVVSKSIGRTPPPSVAPWCGARGLCYAGDRSICDVGVCWPRMR